MSRRSRIARRGRTLFAAVAGLAIAAGAAAQPVHHRAPDVRSAIDGATAGLDLSAAQRADLDRIAQRYEGNTEPGVMWRVADEVRSVLTPAQVERLQERPRAERRRGDGERARGERRRRGDANMRRERMRVHEEHEGRVRRMHRGISEEHVEAARATAERHREQMQALRRQMREGTVDREQFAEQARALREQMHAEMEPMLTEEARRMRAEMMEQHERMAAVRDDVLRLTETQREAMGARDFRLHLNGLNDDAALTPEQRATITIHRALMRGAHGRGAGRVRVSDR